MSLAGGHTFAGGKGHVLIGGGYATDSGIGDMQWQFPRPWANQMRSFVGNSAFATNGLPGVIYSGNVRRADTSTGGLRDGLACAINSSWLSLGNSAFAPDFGTRLNEPCRKLDWLQV
jgi:hypothetical protein